MRAAGTERGLPKEQLEALRKAVVLERISIVYVLSAVGLVLLVMGNSQAMRAAWLEDMLSLLPPIAFLIARRLVQRRPDVDHPYGWHRSVGIAHLASSVALLTMGGFVVVESTSALLSAEHPTIGTMNVFGVTFWQGWAMVAVLAYTGIPNIIIGHYKIRLAKTLHDRVLYADGTMNKDDWATATGAMIGVIGVGLGIWWLDAAIAVAIGIAILRDGINNLRAGVNGLLDVRARTTDDTQTHPLIEQINAAMADLPWVWRTGCRVRDQGHVLHVESFVETLTPVNTAHLRAAQNMVQKLDWTLQDVVIIPVEELPPNLDRRGAGTPDEGPSLRT